MKSILSLSIEREREASEAYFYHLVSGGILFFFYAISWLHVSIVHSFFHNLENFPFKEERF